MDEVSLLMSEFPVFVATLLRKAAQARNDRNLGAHYPQVSEQ